MRRREQTIPSHKRGIFTRLLRQRALLVTLKAVNRTKSRDASTFLILKLRVSHQPRDQLALVVDGGRISHQTVSLARSLGNVIATLAEIACGFGYTIPVSQSSSKCSLSQALFSEGYTRVLAFTCVRSALCFSVTRMGPGVPVFHPQGPSETRPSILPARSPLGPPRTPLATQLPGHTQSTHQDLAPCSHLFSELRRELTMNNEITPPPLLYTEQFYDILDSIRVSCIL